MHVINNMDHWNPHNTWPWHCHRRLGDELSLPSSTPTSINHTRILFIYETTYVMNCQCCGYLVLWLFGQDANWQKHHWLGLQKYESYFAKNDLQDRPVCTPASWRRPPDHILPHIPSVKPWQAHPFIIQGETKPQVAGRACQYQQQKLASTPDEIGNKVWSSFTVFTIYKQCMSDFARSLNRVP